MLEHLTITDEKGAAAFGNARTRTILFALMTAEQSLSQLRAKLAMSLNLLHYHVTRLEGLGLIRVSGTKPRAGRAIKLYRAVAKEFRVPGAISASPATAGLKHELEIALEQAAVRNPTDTVYFLDPQGIPRMRRMPPTKGSAIERWCRLRLSPRAAAELSHELGNLLEKFEQAGARGGQSYLCYFALVRTEHVSTPQR